MTKFASELQDSTNLQVSDGKVTLRRRYRIWGTTFNRENDVIQNAFGDQPVPVYESDGATVIRVPRLYDKDPVFGNLLVSHSYTLQKLGGAVNTWDLEWEFRNVQWNSQTASTPGGLAAGPDAPGFEELTARITGSFTLGYRADPSPPTAVGGTEMYGPGAGDIGGDPIDAGGQPTSVMRYQYEIVRAQVVDQLFDQALASNAASVGTRGSQFGLDSGSVLYRGSNINRIGTNRYRIQHSYLYDSNFHAIQTPKYNKDGLSDLDEDGHVDIVYWKQPFPSSSLALPS